MTTVALVAAKDAEASVSATVRALAAIVDVDEVWVVDDGSTDATAAEAERAGAQVVRLATNRGKGGALAAGVEATPHAHRYLLADADLGQTAGGLAALFSGEPHALVIGVLPPAGSRAGFGGVKQLARAGIARSCGLTLEAPLSGQRLVDGPLLRSLRLAPRFGVEVGMTIDAVRAGATVGEVPVDVEHHHTGRSVAGFTHRGRQGRDIVRALVPRLTTGAQRVGMIVASALMLMLLLTTMSIVSAAPRGAALPTADKVVVFSFDHLGLADLDRRDLPGLHGLARDGVTGALSVRTTDRRSLDRRGGSERPSPTDAYASLGASARVRGVGGLGVYPGDAGAAMAEARRLARHDKAASLPGALGDQLHRAGRKTALVAGAQLLSGTTAGFPAAAALADRRGRIDTVDVSAGLLESTSERVGLRSSVPAFVLATARALRAADVVLVDPGDTARAFDAGADRQAALRRTDLILEGVRGLLPPRTLLLVVSPVPRGADWELTPAVVYATGLRRGTVESPSTRREGLGVLTDVAPTILRALGANADADMTGAALRRADGPFRHAAYDRMAVDGAVRNRFFLSAAVGYTVVALLLYVVLIGLMLVGAVQKWRTPLRMAVDAAATFAPALLLTGAVQHWLHFGGESPVFLSALCLGAGTVAGRCRGVGPVYGLALAASACIAVDVAVTGPLHTSSLLGYSIQTSGRFYGLPNASFSVFATSVILVAVAVAGGWRRKSSVERAVAGTAVLALGCFVVAAPWLGNDVGGTLALVPVSAALAWSFFGRRINTRVGLVGGAAVLVAIAALWGVEALTGSGTHLARAFGSDSLTTTLAHRVNANVGLLVDQWWGFLVFALVGAALVLIARGRLVDELPVGSPLRAGVVAALVLSVAAFAGNDSGPVVTVLCVVVVAPVLALRAIDGDRRRLSRR